MANENHRKKTLEIEKTLPTQLRASSPQINPKFITKNFQKIPKNTSQSVDYNHVFVC